MSGHSAHINSADIGKSGKCPMCDASLNLISETDVYIKWQCSSESCGRNWGRHIEETPT